MDNHLPEIHTRQEPEDLPKADNPKNAVYVSRYHDHHATALGNPDKEEWILAETAYDLDLMR